MTKIIFEGHQIPLTTGETVLNALTRQGINIPNSCNVGVCQSCLMHGEGQIPSEAQKGLNSVQKELGQFLSCCCQPTDTLTVSMASPSEKYEATVLAKIYLSKNVLMLRLSKEFAYKAGQFLTLFNKQGEGRCYSFASHNEMDNFIELHIRIVPNGVISKWVECDLKAGDKVQISSPRGECFYTDDDKDQTLFLSGIGTGFAPLYGILRDALFRGHRGKIYFLVGAKTGSDFYFHSILPSLRSRQVMVHQVALELSNPNLSHCFQADIYDYAKNFAPEMKGVKVYLCGAESFVTKMKKQCFLAGASMKDIYADAFVSAKSRAKAA